MMHKFNGTVLEEIDILGLYLPFKVQVQFWLNENDNGIWTLDKYNLNRFSENDKLILRPMEDINGKIIHQGKEIANPLRETMVGFRYNEYRVLINRLRTNTITYWDMLNLARLHFDVFDLIPVDKAIDIKTIQD